MAMTAKRRAKKALKRTRAKAKRNKLWRPASQAATLDFDLKVNPEGAKEAPNDAPGIRRLRGGGIAI